MVIPALLILPHYCKVIRPTYTSLQLIFPLSGKILFAIIDKESKHDDITACLEELCTPNILTSRTLESFLDNELTNYTKSDLVLIASVHNIWWLGLTEVQIHRKITQRREEMLDLIEELAENPAPAPDPNPNTADPSTLAGQSNANQVNQENPQNEKGDLQS